MILSKFSILSYIISVFVFLISLILAPFYINGDQIHYIYVYNHIQEFDFLKSFYFYNASLSSIEFVHFLFIWIFSFFNINKILFVALSNSFLAYFTILLLKKWNVSIWISMLLVLTNFYLFVLYFAAERLKFGVLFFILSLLYINYRKRFIFYFIVALMSHVQMLIIYLSIFFNFFINSIYKISKTKKVSKFILYATLIVVMAIMLMYNQILVKFNSYDGVRGFQVFYKSILFFILALFYSKNKTETIILFIPLFIAIFFIGDIRIDMFSYFIFLYYALRVNNGLNIGVVTTSIYFAVKSAFFVYNILMYGNGFYHA